MSLRERISTTVDRIVMSGPVRRIGRALVMKQGVPVVERTLIQNITGGTGDDPFAHTDLAAYKSHSWVFACVRVIATNGAGIPLVLNRVRGDKVSTVETHRVAELLARPNPWCSREELMERTLSHLELTGDSFWWLVRENGIFPKMILGLNPANVRVVAGEETPVSHYVYTATRTPIPIPVGDMLHFKYFNPDGDIRGQGTIDAARRTIALDIDARKYNRAFFKNGARVGLGLMYKQSLDDGQRERIKEEFRATHQGTDKAFDVMVLEGATDIKDFKLSQRDIEFLEMMKFNRDEIASVFGVPKVLLNARDKGIFQNNEKDVAFFWHENMIPKMTMTIAGPINHSMHKLFGVPFGSSGPNEFKIKPSFLDVWALKAELLQLAKIDTEMIKDGRRTANEIRAREGRDPNPWGDIWWRPQGLTPWDAPSPLGGTIPSTRSAAPEIVAPTATITVVKDLEREKRLAEWKGFIVGSDHFERGFKSIVSSLTRDQQRETLANLRALQNRIADRRGINLRTFADAHGWLPQRVEKRPMVKADIEAVLFDLDAALDAAVESSTGIYERMVKHGGRLGFEQTGATGRFDSDSVLARRQMQAAQQRFATKVPQKTWDLTREFLVQSLDVGASFAEMAEGIELTMGGRIASSGLTIARTEVIGTLNGGITAGYQQSGVVKSRTWLTAGDGEVRDDHIDAEGQEQPLERAFEVGGSSLMYPGDPGGDAEQVINCRCTVFPVIQN